MKTLFFIAFLSFPLYSLGQNESLIENVATDNPICSVEYPQDSIKKILHLVFNPFDIDVNKIDQTALYLRAIEWIGVNYGYGQNSRKGIDCSNFTKILVNGILTSNLTGTSNEIYKQCIAIERNMLKEGDLVFFKVNKPYISHVGVYLQNNKFIHATINNGIIISDLNEAYYKKYYFASGRLKN